jgi:hypothetical protein
VAARASRKARHRRPKSLRWVNRLRRWLHPTRWCGIEGPQDGSGLWSQPIHKREEGHPHRMALFSFVLRGALRLELNLERPCFDMLDEGRWMPKPGRSLNGSRLAARQADAGACEDLIAVLERPVLGGIRKPKDPGPGSIVALFHSARNRGRSAPAPWIARAGRAWGKQVERQILQLRALQEKRQRDRAIYLTPKTR